jgi:hypothetical protein
MLRRLLYGALGLALLAGSAFAVGTIVDLNGLMYSLTATPSPNSKVPLTAVVDINGLPTGTTTSPTVVASTPYPSGATPTSSSSAIVANAAATATLAGVASKLTYISGFSCQAGGATAAASVDLTVTGVQGGTMHYSFTFPVLGTSSTVNEDFSYPVPSSAVNTSIVVSLPAGGAGNVSASCVAAGFTL